MGPEQIYIKKNWSVDHWTRNVTTNLLIILISIGFVASLDSNQFGLFDWITSIGLQPQDQGSGKMAILYYTNGQQT